MPSTLQDIRPFIQLLEGGDTESATLQSLGGGAFISSQEVPIYNSSLLYGIPYKLAYGYSLNDNNITLSCDTVQEVRQYTLGFRDFCEKVEDITNPVPVYQLSC